MHHYRCVGNLLSVRDLAASKGASFFVSSSSPVSKSSAVRAFSSNFPFVPPSSLGSDQVGNSVMLLSV